MLASLDDAPRVSPGLAYEPKYDGIRAIVEIAPAARASERPRPARGASEASRRAPAAGGGAPAASKNDDALSVQIYSRLGNEKTSQFPALVEAFQQIGRTLGHRLIIDGEIVALDKAGKPVGFQRLQGRMHLTGKEDIRRAEGTQPVAYIAFDLLRDGDEDLRPRPWSERRARLEARLGKLAKADGPFRISEVARGDGRDLDRRAHDEGWEGLIAKEMRSPYHSGRRSPAWRKLKNVRRQEFVVGGWTEPRNTRSHFGALLLGVFEAPAASASERLRPARGASAASRRARASGGGAPRASNNDGRAPRAQENDGKLTYVGHVGTGFDEKELARVAKLLKARETTTSPFASRVPVNERAHWVRPELVAEVRFTEWTDEKYLRHPVYLGLRDDKKPAQVSESARGPGERRPRPAGGGGAPPAARAGGAVGRASSRSRGLGEPERR